MLSSNGNSTLDMLWSRPWNEQACTTSSHVSITISHDSEPFIDGHSKNGNSKDPKKPVIMRKKLRGLTTDN